MKRFVDANVALRFLTGEPPDLAARARALIAGEGLLWLTETALLETAHVLERVIGLPRDEVVDGLVAFIQLPNIRLHGLELPIVLRALLLSRPSRRVSIGDALIWAVACQEGGEVHTFDRRFPRVDVPVREP